MSAGTSLKERLGRKTDESRVEEQPIPGFVRVNLLPDTYLERARVATAKRIAAGAVGGALVATVGLWGLAQVEASRAQSDLDAAQATAATLQAELNQYRQVPIVFAAADTAQAALNNAMGREVRWSFLLNQLSFSTPSGVTLVTISGQTGAAPIEEEAETQVAGDLLPPTSPVGSMQFLGQASSFGAVASWLESLATLQDYVYPFFTDATDAGTDAFETAVQFDSSAELTDAALSGRYGPPETSGNTGVQPSPTPSANESASPSPSSSGAESASPEASAEPSAAPSPTGGEQ